MTDQTNTPLLPVVAHLHASAFDYFVSSDDNHIVEPFGQYELCIRRDALEYIEELREENARLKRELVRQGQSCSQTISDRDHAKEKGTELAEAVGAYFRVEVGEYSNANDPRDMAIAILAGEYVTDSDDDRLIAELKSTPPQADSIRNEALEDAAEIAGKHHREYEETKQAHHRLSSQPFRPDSFGLNRSLVSFSATLEKQIRALKSAEGGKK